MTAITCSVVSPEKELFEGEVRHFVAPGWDGEIGIYPRHAPLVARLGPGMVRLEADGNDSTKFAIRGGLMTVKDDEATLLVTHAVRADEVDVRELEMQFAELKQELKSPGTDERYRELLTERQWIEVRLAMAR